MNEYRYHAACTCLPLAGLPLFSAHACHTCLPTKVYSTEMLLLPAVKLYNLPSAYIRSVRDVPATDDNLSPEYAST